MGLEKLIQYIKRDKNYMFSSQLTLYELLVITYYRLVQVLRGILVRPFLKSSSGLIFIGSRTKLHFKMKISVGRNVIIDDNVYMNAFSENGIQLGDNVTITRDSILVASGVIRRKGVGIKIGNNTGLNARAYLGGQGGIEIGDTVIIGPDVKIFSENHIFDSINLPIKYQGESRIGVKIGDNCWIGSGCTILDGVEIGSGSVVAAGAVVTTSFPPNSVIGGIPAKLIKKRE